MSETMKDYEAEINASFRKIDAGDIVTGTVIAVTEEEVTVDLRYYAPGIIRAADFRFLSIYINASRILFVISVQYFH